MGLPLATLGSGCFAARYSLGPAAAKPLWSGASRHCCPSLSQLAPCGRQFLQTKNAFLPLFLRSLLTILLKKAGNAHICAQEQEPICAFLLYIE
ncbi:hypothetical protein SGRA_0592 [Saprospira grandis str. Lewin]|uniref:Uncharacterized protein n=1 Tax=Saprospira grandis (strain Lewin) TaxID=984262 RepID=H6KZ47_SAPGL|nr:hypothetical protein SGRA_0592 [Saprospira grandis str. Lewin]